MCISTLSREMGGSAGKWRELEQSCKIQTFINLEFEYKKTLQH